MRFRGIRLLLGALCAGSLALACAAPQRPIDFQAVQPGPASADGLRRVEGREVSAAYMRPEVVFAAYDQVTVDPLKIVDKEGTRPLDLKSRERLEQIYEEAFQRQLGRSEAFTVAPERGPRTLRVSGRIVNLDVRMPRYRGGEKKMVLDSGEMTLILDVRDAESGESLARIADRRRIRPQGVTGRGNSHTITGGAMGYEESPVNVWGAMREIVDDWARIVRQGLDDLHAMAPVPIPDELGEG